MKPSPAFGRNQENGRKSKDQKLSLAKVAYKFLKTHFLPQVVLPGRPGTQLKIMPTDAPSIRLRQSHGKNTNQARRPFSVVIRGIAAPSVGASCLTRIDDEPVRDAFQRMRREFVLRRR